MGVDVSVIIVNWNRSDLLMGCLQSIQQRTHRVAYEIVIVDNASSDDSVARVRAGFPTVGNGRCAVPVHLICNTENRGFAAANNQGLKVCQGRYALLLNNDTVVLDGCLDTMVAFMDAHSDAGALTCKQFDARDLEHPMPPCATAFPTPTRVMKTRLARLLRKENTRWGQRWLYLGDNPEVEQEAAHITGSCFMIRREAFEQVGLLDERFFFYLEETDWCWRLREAGWKIYYTPAAAFIHYLSASGQLRSDREELYYRAYCAFFEKHYGKPARWLYQAQKGLFGVLKRVLGR
jgi:hypothetical protein